jgi:hypothetical protein
MSNMLAATVTGCSELLSVNVSDSHGAATSTATIRCLSCGLDVGDSISVSLGYSGNTEEVFTGYVKMVTRSQQPTVYEITAANVLVRAVDYFIASTNPDQPFSRSKISAEALIGELMAMAGITNYSGQSTGFTFATKGEPVEVNLTSVYDFSKFIADTLAWHLYADVGGTVRFEDRPPYPDGGGSVASLDGTNMLSASFYRSDRDLRNRVVVYGKTDVYAEAKASSPYLPSGFYKTVVIAAPQLISTNALASSIASYNLNKLNRLTIGGMVTAVGNPSINARSNVTVDRSAIGMSGTFYVYSCEHDWGQAGYTTIMELRQ